MVSRRAAAPSGLSQVSDVSAVAAPDGHVRRRQLGGNAARGHRAQLEGGAFLTVFGAAVFASLRYPAQARLHQVAGPAGRSVVMASVAQVNRDSIAAVTDRLPMVLG